MHGEQNSISCQKIMVTTKMLLNSYHIFYHILCGKQTIFLSLLPFLPVFVIQISPFRIMAANGLTLICSVSYISSLSKRKSIKLIFKIPLSSYQRLPISFLTTIFGNESPVKANGRSSASAFSSVGIEYAD